MATAKTARSRGSAAAKENGPKLEESLGLFKSDNFNADAFVQSRCSLNEKDVKQLCSYLLDLKRASADEMRRSVYANYAAFIRTSKEISDLEGELSSIRNLLSTQAALIHGLSEGVHIDSLSVPVAKGSAVNNLYVYEGSEPSELEKWLIEFPDLLDVLLAERRVDEALAALSEGERVASEAKQMKTLTPAVLMSLQTSIIERRQKLADQLAEAACQPSTRGDELREAISALKQLGDGPRAHSLLLNAHLQRYQYNMQSLRPSSTSYGGAYTAALSQLVFSAIAQAASDSLAIFGQEPAYTSELVMWATKQTEAFALLVKRYALASSAAAGGLRAAAECVQIALGHCSLLEARGLALCPVLLRLFRPSVEQALDANLKRIEESTAALAAADDWILTCPPATRQSGRPSGTSLGSATAFQHKLTSSAHRFNLMVQDFFEDVGPLLSMQLGGQTLEGLFQVFNSYVSMLIKALPGSMEEEANFESSGNKIVRMAENEAQQMALLANASLLADELLPRAAMKLSPPNQVTYRGDTRRRPLDRQNRHPEQREWKRRLVRQWSCGFWWDFRVHSRREMGRRILNEALRAMVNAERRRKATVELKPISTVMSSFLKIMKDRGYIKNFQVYDPHRVGRITVELQGRINDCRALTYRQDIKARDIEGYRVRMLPTHQWGYVVITTPDGVLDHEEAIKRNVGGQVLGYFH